MRRLVAWKLAACLLLSATSVVADTCRDDTVHLRGDWGEVRFRVEVADSVEERSQGLMHRESMARGSGMLFIYPRPQRVAFWMRNTLIPLDMLFMDKSGVVQKIHHNAIPLDETQIPGGSGILTVLEINGGLSQALGITAGTEMRHPSVNENWAAWPCDKESSK